MHITPSEPNTETSKTYCQTCHGEARILHFWNKPGGVGNGWSGCPDCDAGKEYTAQLMAGHDRFELYNMQEAHATEVQAALSKSLAYMSGSYPPWMTDEDAKADAMKSVRESLSNHLLDLKWRASGKAHS